MSNRHTFKTMLSLISYDHLQPAYERDTLLKRLRIAQETGKIDQPLADRIQKLSIEAKKIDKKILEINLST